MNKSKKVGFARGAFDLLHIGHLKFLQKCKEYCDFLIVGVFSDELTSLYKRRPFIPFKERIELVEALKPVDLTVKVTKNEGEKSWNEHDHLPLFRELAKRWKITIFFRGGDWRKNKRSKRQQKVDNYFNSIDGKVIYIPYYKGRTTTEIINKIKRKEKKSNGEK